MSNLPPFPGANSGYPQSNPYATNYNNQPASNPYATNYNPTTPPTNTYQAQPSYGGGNASYGTPQYGTPSSSQYGTQPADTTAYAGSSGAFHSYSKEECRGFVNYVNEWLQGDVDLQGLLAINPNTEDIFRIIGTTCLLCKLINAIKPGIIDDKKIRRGPLSVFQQTENLNLGIQGCKDLGVVVSNVSSQDLLEAKPHMVLGLLWQIVKIGLLSKLNFQQHPELVVMLSPTEDVQTFMRSAPEMNLLRWFNWQLQRGGYPRNVNNFGSDIRDAQPYLALLEQIAPHVVPRGVHQEPNPTTRAQYVCDYANQLGCGNFLTPDDILAGNEKLNMAFTAYLFNKYPGLEGGQDNTSQQKLAQAQALMKSQYEEEERLRAQRWNVEEDKRKREWEEQEKQRRMVWELEEGARRERLRLEEEAARARLAAEEARLREWQRKQEEDARRLEEENRRREEEARRLAEEKRRLEEEEAKRRAAEEEARRRAAEEEARRRAYEEQRRYEEEQRRKALAEEEARRKAWDEYNAKQQANQQAMVEEQRRRAAWDDYNRQQELARQQAAAAEEARRQAAWAQYQAEQQAAAAAAAAQQQAMMTMAAQQQAAAAAAAQQQAMMTIAAQQQAAMLAAQMTTVTVATPPPVQKTTTVTTVKTTPAKPAKWPIPRLIITVIRGHRLIKSDLFGKSDPYVKLVHNGNAQKTTWLKNTTEPVYNQDFEFRNVAQSDIILLQVWDHDTLGKDNFMGEVKLTGADFVDNESSAFELRSRDFRADRVHGDVLLKFRLIYT